MATPDGSISRPIEISDENSEAGSSYTESEASGPPRIPGASICGWRTAQYYERECSRYFDCPSHVVERAHSDDEDTEARDGRAEEDSSAVSPLSEDTPAEQRLQMADHMELDAPAIPEPTAASTAGASSATNNSRGDVDRGSQDVGARARSPAEATSSRAVPTPLIVTEDEASPRRPSSKQVAGNGPLDVVDLTDRGVNTMAARMSQSQQQALTSRDLPAAPPPPPPPPRTPYVMGRPQRHGPGIHASDTPESPRRFSSDIMLPRWQPDAEVTYCPICHTQFSIFVRKHHCRKCGRVVCASCSPHRITIPYQYIVQPPGTPRVPAQRYSTSLAGGDSGYTDFSTIGGGERVRLCNPCVPDPNTTPPQTQDTPAQRHLRSQSNVGGGANTSTRRYGTYFPPVPPNDALSRSRSATLHGSDAPSSARPAPAGHYLSTQSRILAGTPPAYFPSPQHHAALSATRHRSLLDVAPGGLHPPVPHALQRRSLPPPPPLLPEEDECPVCHRELPPRSLANFEALREAHITICITTHSGDSGGESSTARRTTTGMFPYAATEKDCVDSAECTICLEEFEVGIPMARLECLCRFHRACISAWFVGHPGRCPVHQHDGFGY